jgi:hypothetical protein
MKGKTLTEPVAFQTLKLSMRLQIKGSPSEQQDPAAAVHPLTKWATFLNGLFQTDDPEIIQVLDARDDVWRAGDRKGGLKAKYGDRYAELAAEFGAVASSEPASVEEAE